MVTPIVKPRAKVLSTKEKYDQLIKANKPSKHTKKSKISSFLSRFQPYGNNK